MQPTPYSRDYSFTDFQAGDPSTPLPGAKVDAELDHAADTLGGVLANLALIQRDDGKLVDSLVDLDALDQNVLLAIAAAIITYTRGADAPSPNFTFDVVTLAPGAPATASVTGVYPNLMVHLGVPKGDPSIGGATLEDADYGDVVVSAGGSVMAVTGVNGEDPYRAGNQPAVADVAGLAAALAAIPWASLTGVPATFPPDAHTHDDRYYTDAEVDALLAGKQAAGAYVTAAQLAGKADALTTVKSFSTSQVPSDAAHNGCYCTMTGATGRNITFGAAPAAGHCSIWVNRGSANMTVVCGGGYWKNGAAAQSVANFTLAPGQKLTAFHEGGGDWAFEITG